MYEAEFGGTTEEVSEAQLAFGAKYPVSIANASNDVGSGSVEDIILLCNPSPENLIVFIYTAMISNNGGWSFLENIDADGAIYRKVKINTPTKASTASDANTEKESQPIPTFT